jgi:hypothetical protein
MKSTYTRGSLIHRSMEHLERQPRAPESLRNMLLNISISRFNEYVTAPLIADGFAKQEEDVLYLTTKGREKYYELGMVKSKLPSSHKTDIMGTTYDGAELKLSAVRLGADDHIKFPSRNGNELRYRNGTVEELTS